ncbi:MAG: preprotein translocase subunit YajC [Thermoanaerobaculia bacterium]
MTSLVPLALQQAQGAPLWTTLAPLAIMVLIFYLIWWMPMRKRQRAHQQMLDGLKKGDKVVTSGGLLGEVVSAEGAILVLKLSDTVRVRVTRGAISGLQQESES